MNVFNLQAFKRSRQISERLRDLGGLETLSHLYGELHPTHFCVVVDVAGSIEPARFRQALDLVQRRHPLLAASIAMEHGRFFFRKTPEPIELDMIEAGDDFEWRSIVGRQLATRFSDTDAPLLRATVLGGENRAVIVLCFHHAIADGISGVHVAGDLLKLLSDGFVPELPLLPSREVLVEGRLMRFGAILPPVLPPGLDTSTLDRSGERALWRPFDATPPTVETAMLQADLTSSLLEASRRQGTTVHGAICAAIARRRLAHRSGETARITSHIDLRGALGVHAGDCALLIERETVQFAERDVGFWVLARQAVAGLADARSSNGIVERSRLTTALVAAGATSRTISGLVAMEPSDALVSNLGIVPIRSVYGSLVVKEFWGPMVLTQLSGHRTVGAATHGGRLRLTVTSHEPSSGFLADLERDLRSVAGASGNLTRTGSRCGPVRVR